MCAFDAYRAWWADVANRRAPKTARLYRYHVLRFFADVGREPASLTRGRIKDYLSTLSRPHAAAIQDALTDFFDFLVQHGHRSDNPMREIKRRPRGRRRIKRGLTPDELVRLLIAARYMGHGRKPWHPEGERLAWAILAQAMTGIRPGELLSLRTDQLHLNGSSSSATIYASKTDFERVVPLNRVASEALSHLSAGRSGVVFGLRSSQFWAKVHRCAIAAGIDPAKARPYALRHTFASWLVDAGVHIRTVAELLGHSSLKHTMTYTQPDDPQLRAAVDALTRESCNEH